MFFSQTPAMSGMSGMSGIVPSAGGHPLEAILAYSPTIWLSAGLSYPGADDSLVSSRSNLGTQGGSFVQATEAKRPTYRVDGMNGKPSFQFAGGQCLQLASALLSSDFALVVLFSATANGFLCEQSATANDNAGIYTYTSNDFTSQVNRPGVGVSSRVLTSNWGIDDTPRVVRFSCDGTHAGHKVFINGVDQAATNGFGTGNPGVSNATDTLNVGSRNNAAGVALTGHISELLVVTRANAAAVETILNSYYEIY